MLGVTWFQFWELNPHKIKIISIGYQEQKKEEDAIMHSWWGTYGLSAITVAVEHCLAGRKAKSKYVEKPILSQIQEKTKENKILTEDEKQAQLDKFVMSLKIMESNFNAEHKK